MKLNLKLIVFGIDDEYNLYVLLDSNNNIYTQEFHKGLPKKIRLIINGMFLSLLGFDANFSKIYLSDIEISGEEETSVYYFCHIPVDTFDKEGYKWVKVNETTYKQAKGNDDRTCLSVESYQAIRMAIGQRKHEDYSTSPGCGV